MSIYVTALERGGYAAYGGCYYDPRERVIRLGIVDPDDAHAVTVEFNSTPTEISYEEDGISSSTPAISGNSVTILFQALNPNGRYKLVTYFASGASKTTHFVADPAQPATDGAITADIDYGEI